MSETLTPTQKLDAVLEYMVQVSRPPYRFITEILDEFKNGGWSLDDNGYSDELYRILQKLTNDGYVFTEQREYKPSGLVNVYFVTFEGKLFLQSGGYDGQREEVLRQKIIQNSENAIARRNSNLAAYGAIGAAVGALGVLLFEVIKFWCQCN
jgi:DNA-binding PadR family transcriptional regulator